MSTEHRATSAVLDSHRREVARATIVIDLGTSTVAVAGTYLELTATEWALLTALASDPVRLWSKPDLLKAVWGRWDASKTRTLDSHASRLRGRLTDAGAAPDRFVINQWGRGYRLVAPHDDAAVAVIDTTGLPADPRELCLDVLRRLRDVRGDAHLLATLLDEHGQYALEALTAYAAVDQLLSPAIERLVGIKDRVV